MKYCPVCNNSYPNHFRVCPQDNSVLRQTGELVPGMVIRSKYEILDHIGAGGMADVYRARHLAFNEIYAIKVVKPTYADDQAFNHRFKSEAVLTRKLRHPNAIAVEDYDTTEDGRPYIVMELVEGRDLRTVIDQDGPLPEARTLNLARQIAAALSAAHKLGITHRDIKPDNVLITTDERGNEVAKVLDFGIARAKEGAFTNAAYTATRQGMVVGTPQYMSPEQACGKVGDDIDCRADVYSLGVVIYEMITGKLPFESDTPMGYCFKHVHTVPTPPREFAADLNISPALSKLVMKALEKERQNRFSSMEEFMDALADPDRWAGIAKCADAAATLVAPVADFATIVSKPSVSGTHSDSLQTSQQVRSTTPDFAAIEKAPRSSTKVIVWLATAILIAAICGGIAFTLRSGRASIGQAPEQQVVAPVVNEQTPHQSQPDIHVAERQAPSNQAATSSTTTVVPAPKPDPVTPAVTTKPLTDDQKRAQELVALGQQQLASGNYTSAINRFSLALELDPSNAAAQAGLAKARAKSE